jgi:large subunit ribosomal protein L35
MPKMKTHRGAAKRFKKTGTGKFKRNKAFTSHMMNHKPSKRTKMLRQSTLVHKTNEESVKKMLPYA